MEFNPSTVYIPITQHVGKPASAVVNVGDRVTVGQVVAQTPYEDLGTSMHSSINGIVAAVTDRFVVINRD